MNTHPPVLLQSPHFFAEQLANAREALTTGFSFDTAPEYPPKINARLRIVSDVSRERASQIKQSDMMPVTALLRHSFAANKSKAHKIMWIRRAADQFSSAVGPHSACKAGCSHCCHIPVSIGLAEAQLIGKAIGIQPASNQVSTDLTAGHLNPCVFLRNNSCSIYEHRPIVCRTHFNMDTDALLCELIPGGSVPVPYMDARPFVVASMSISGLDGQIADIRQWFPNGVAA